MSRNEGLLKSSHAYFKHSSNKHLEFAKLAKLMGLKLLNNVKTRWVSLIEPLRRILQEYMVRLAKMKVDNVSKEKYVHVKCLFFLFFCNLVHVYVSSWLVQGVGFMLASSCGLLKGFRLPVHVACSCCWLLVHGCRCMWVGLRFKVHVAGSPGPAM